jgi:hypothetical protein
MLDVYFIMANNRKRSHFRICTAVGVSELASLNEDHRKQLDREDGKTR